MPHTREQNTAYRRDRYHRDPVFQVKHRDATQRTKGLPTRGWVQVSMVEPVVELQTMIERVPAQGCTRWFYDWKHLRDDGWNVSVLASPDRSELIGLACRWGERWRYL
jgi:hypothetical protein